MAIQLSPGVQVIEKDLTSIIPQVSSSRGAMAGMFKWGPMMEPITVTTESELAGAFGRPTDSSYQWFYTAANFLKYSNNLLAVRMDTASALNSVAVPTGGVRKVTIVNNGAGYTAAPYVWFENPAMKGGRPATAEAVLRGAPLIDVNIVNDQAGQDYLGGANGDTVVFSQPDVKVKDSNGNMVYKVATGYLVVDDNGSITNVVLTDGGDGYINPPTVGVISSTGTGASLAAVPDTSSIAEIKIINAGSGYDKEEIQVYIEAIPTLQNPSGIAIPAVAVAEVRLSGVKIKNNTHYNQSFAAGQAVKGEWAGKFPGDQVNGYTVSMADAATWTSVASGKITTMTYQGDKNDEVELIAVRGFGTSFATQLQPGRAIRAINEDGTEGALIGSIKSIPGYGNTPVVRYRLVTLQTPISADNISYNDAIRGELASPGVVEVAVTNGGSNFAETDKIVFDAPDTQGSTATGTLTIIDGKVAGVVMTNFGSGYTKVPNVSYTDVDGNPKTGYVQPTVEVFVNKYPVVGYVDGMPVVPDGQSDTEVSQFYVRLAEGFSGDLAQGETLKTQEYTDLGVIAKDLVKTTVDEYNQVTSTTINGVVPVETLYLESSALAEVDQSAFGSEWKYKSAFRNAPGTSDFAASRNVINDEMHIVVLNKSEKIVEKFADVSKAANAKLPNGRNNYYKDVVNSSSKIIRWIDHTDVVNDTTEQIIRYSDQVKFGSDVFGEASGLIVSWIGGDAGDNPPGSGTLGTVSVANGGTGYHLGDIILVAGGANGKIRVDGITGSGTVTGVSVISDGIGYAASGTEVQTTLLETTSNYSISFLTNSLKNVVDAKITVGSTIVVRGSSILSNNQQYVVTGVADDGSFITVDSEVFGGTGYISIDVLPNITRLKFGEDITTEYEDGPTVSFVQMTSDVTRTLSGGVDSTSASAQEIINAYSLFANDETYDLSLIPMGPASAAATTWVIQNVAEKRKDCVVFASAAFRQGSGSAIAQAIVADRNKLPSSSYAVMDSTWKYQYDSYNDKYRWIPMNGDTAGLCANTDMVADPWFSPGGLNRGIVKNVVKVAYNPVQAERDILYQAGVNPIVTFPGTGTVLFGDKTLQKKASAFDRINVRRLFIVLEKAIATAAKYQLFEFNDEFTRAQFRNLVEPFLRDIQGRRGIVDFRVKCDESNNTAEIIDSNQFVADIYIKPNRSINFITLNFIATKSGASFDEIGL